MVHIQRSTFPIEEHNFNFEIGTNFYLCSPIVAIYSNYPIDDKYIINIIFFLKNNLKN